MYICIIIYTNSITLLHNRTNHRETKHIRYNITKLLYRTAIENLTNKLIYFFLKRGKNPSVDLLVDRRVRTNAVGLTRRARYTYCRRGCRRRCPRPVRARVRIRWRVRPPFRRRLSRTSHHVTAADTATLLATIGRACPSTA